MIKKFSMIMACIIALILSAVFCTANVIHASGEDLSVSDEAVSEEAAGSQTNGNWPVDITKDDCTIDLSLTYKQDGKTLPLNGGSLALYTVATVKVENGYVFDVEAGQFASVSGVDAIPGMTTAELEAQNPTLAKALEAAASSQGITPTATAEISGGTASFTGLKAGLYLVAQKEKSEGSRKINAFLISIPDAEGNYNLKAAPKNGIVVPPTPTPTVTPTPKLSITPTPTPKTKITPTITPRTKVTVTPRPKVTTVVRKTTVLPKTGQAWLPVFILAAVGVVLVVVGQRVRR